MRTVIFAVGMYFVDTLRSHWHIPKDTAVNFLKVYALVFLGGIILDILETVK